MKETANQYYQLVSRQHRVMLVMGLFLAASVLIALNVGPIRLNWSDLWADAHSLQWRILVDIRFPRVLAAILAGGALSMSGLAMQHVLRNPLASPFTLGVSGAAAFGAAFAIVVFGVPSWLTTSQSPVAHVASRFFTGGLAFLFSLLSVFIILLVMKRRGSRPSVIVLAGIMTSSLFSACTSALQYFADDRQLAEIVFWTFGDPGRAGYVLLLVQSAIILPVMIWMIRHRWDFALLQSGDDAARAGGLNPARFRLRVLILASLVTSAVVSGYGIISFVGLVAPHLCRPFIKGQSMAMGASVLFGGLFLLLSDILARSILQPVILPVSIVTAFFGAPFFIVMLIQNREL